MFKKYQAKLALLSPFGDWFLKLSLLLIIIPLFVPFSPKMPAPGLDPSWALALNQAVAQGLAFGKDILFTLGPYSSIYTKAYHPTTDLMMMSGSLYLAVAYWLCLLILMQGSQWRWILALGVFLALMIYAKDSLFFSYPLLVGLISFKLIIDSRPDPKSTQYLSNMNLPDAHFPLLILILIVPPLGLLPLIKGSLLILCAVIVFLCALLFSYYQQKTQAFLCLILPLIAMILFWSAAGQSLVNLPNYIKSTIALAAGFSEAMSLDGDESEIILYLISSIAILCVIGWNKRIAAISKLFLLALFFIFLFLSFKTGFTRHFGHAFISGTSILFAALLLPYLFKSKLIVPVIVLSTFTTLYIDGQYTHISLINNFRSTYSSAWYGFGKRISEAHWLSQNFALTMDFLKNQIDFPLFPGTTDIYSYDQTYLIASRNHWTPRPIFQSYSVFTSELAKKNKHYLLSPHAPDHIMFKVEPIDNRMAALEDGASWPVLLKHYQPTGFDKGFLWLEKQSVENKASHSTLLQSTNYHLGEVVKLPQASSFLWAEIEMKPTILGSLATILFKPDLLYIQMTLQDGSIKKYRFIANMAKSDFLLSPLIEDTKEFALLYATNNMLHSKHVISFFIDSKELRTRHWHQEYKITLKSIN
jgi:hypothetical protein